MSAQPEALRLADLIQSRFGSDINDEAAAELRRLHKESELLWKEREEPHQKIGMYMSECNRLEKERDAMREENQWLKERLEAIAKIAGSQQ